MSMSGVGTIYASGDCEIDLARRELRIRGAPVPVGTRAFEIIEVLAESAGELVTKNDLMNRIWPGAIVLDNTLQVHATAIRKALGPYRALLKTEFGRGYRLLGGWEVRQHAASRPPTGMRQVQINRESSVSNLPSTVTCLVGRKIAVTRLLDLLSAYRLVTLTGSGGVGKTSLALKVAHHMVGNFVNGGALVELGPLSDPELVPSAVARACRLWPAADRITAETVARAAGSRELLLVLDNCEHVVDAAAELADMFLRCCPRVTILATSREALRIDGECVCRVPPLEVPAVGMDRPDDILTQSAVELFIARAAEQGSDFAPSDAILPAVASICRDLDGLPLAIEFAATLAVTLGVALVAAGLRDRFDLLTNGRRTAPPRHRTLRAALDWSFDLLTNAERVLFRRLAVFTGGFSLDAVRAVTPGGELSERSVFDCVTNLVAKSLVMLDATQDGQFSLLETTRAYALHKLREAGEHRDVAQRHADYYHMVFGNLGNRWPIKEASVAELDNVRSALEWCFGEHGDRETGVGLAGASVPVLLAMSLLRECRLWYGRALSALDDSARGGVEEMQLQACFGVASMQMQGESDAARNAIQSGLAIAEARGHVLYQVGLLGMLSMFHTRDANFKSALHYAQLSRQVPGVEPASVGMALGESCLGRALHFTGDHATARAALEASFRYWSGVPRGCELHLGLDHRLLVSLGLARTLWLQGYPARAVESMRRIIADAQHADQPASLGVALSWAPGVFLWTGDLASADQHADWLLSHAETHSEAPYHAVGLGHKGVLAIRQGDAQTGVDRLQQCLKRLAAMRYGMRCAEFRLPLAQGLEATGRFDEALMLVDETIGQMEANGELLWMPEALRVKGRALLAMPVRRPVDAERVFHQSIEWSRRQAARSWDLRTAIDLAALWATQGRQGDARELLAPLLTWFTEGLDTEDLRAAERLLATFR